MNKSEFLEEFAKFLQESNYLVSTQAIYLSDVKQFISFVSNLKYPYCNNLEFMFNPSKKDFEDFVVFLKELRTSNRSLARKYFALKALSDFLFKKYHIDFNCKIYLPNFLQKTEKLIINDLILKIKNFEYKEQLNVVKQDIIPNFIIFYLSNILKIAHKTIVCLNKQDVIIRYNYLIILNKKFKCNKDVCFIIRQHVHNLNFPEDKLFNVTYQASIAISKNFLLKLNNNSVINDFNCNYDYKVNTLGEKLPDVHKIYKKAHPRS